MLSSSQNPRHPFHLVDTSPWPLFASFVALGIVVGTAVWFHHYVTAFWLLGFFTAVLGVMYVWWSDMVDERLFLGYHTNKVKVGMRLGTALFILSELMFFFTFFWSYFHMATMPAVTLGAQWPPLGIVPVNMYNMPFTNTALLLASGISLTWSHHSLMTGKREQTIIGLIVTLFLALLFTLLQVDEYLCSMFDMSDASYGSLFFLMTGFHGVHVAMGTTFLTFCLIRAYKWHFTPGHHFGFEAAAWYWHFVDVVWLVLFAAVYGWGSLTPYHDLFFE